MQAAPTRTRETTAAARAARADESGQGAADHTKPVDARAGGMFWFSRKKFSGS